MLIEEIKSLPIFGKIPNGWKVMHSDDVSIKISKGTTPPKQDISDSGSIPFLRVNNLAFNGKLNKDSDFIFVSKEAHENFLARSKAYPGDVLMNIVGPPLGKIAILEHTYSQYNMNQAIVFYRLDKTKVDAEFFLSYLKSHFAQTWLISRSKKTSGQQNLTIELCKQLPIPLPELPEQKKIAEILTTWDKAIATTEKLLENSQKQKQALMQQLLTGKKRFSSFNEKWSTKTLGQIGEIKSAGVDKNILEGEKPVRLLNFTDVFNRSFIYSKELNHWVTAPDAKVLSCGVEKGDVFLTPSSETRDEVGIPAVAAEDISDCCYSYHVVRFRLHENWDLNFKAYIFTTTEFRKQAYMMADGSGQRYVISQDGFRSIKITYPTYQEQILIGKAIKAAEDEVNSLKQKITYLKEEKKALMQQLLTGKRRVKIDS